MQTLRDIKTFIVDPIFFGVALTLIYLAVIDLIS